MRKINSIIIHCAATPEGKDFTVADIDRWHKKRGWKGIGYHFVIYRDGSVHEGRPLAQAGAHCVGHNAESIGICYIGGVDAAGKPKDTRTPQQKEALVKLVAELRQKYNISKQHIYGRQRVCTPWPELHHAGRNQPDRLPCAGQLLHRRRRELRSDGYGSVG